MELDLHLSRLDRVSDGMILGSFPFLAGFDLRILDFPQVYDTFPFRCDDDGNIELLTASYRNVITEHAAKILKLMLDVGADVMRLDSFIHKAVYKALRTALQDRRDQKILLKYGINPEYVRHVGYTVVAELVSRSSLRDAILFDALLTSSANHQGLRLFVDLRELAHVCENVLSRLPPEHLEQSIFFLSRFHPLGCKCFHETFSNLLQAYAPQSRHDAKTLKLENATTFTRRNQKAAPTTSRMSVKLKHLRKNRSHSSRITEINETDEISKDSIHYKSPGSDIRKHRSVNDETNNSFQNTSPAKHQIEKIPFAQPTEPHSPAGTPGHYKQTRTFSTTYLRAEQPSVPKSRISKAKQHLRRPFFLDLAKHDTVWMGQIIQPKAFCNYFKRKFRPRVVTGLRRVEWTCVGFKNSSPVRQTCCYLWTLTKSLIL